MNGRRVGLLRRHGRVRGATAALAAVATISMAVPFLVTQVASGANGTPARSATMNEGGFPSWYEDANGVRVVPCLDPNDANCLAPLAGDTYDPNLPLSFPTNYPDELFYSAADSQPITVSGTGCAASGGDVSVHLALEASFMNGAIVNGDQAVFGRIRLSGRGASGLCAGTWYTFRTPYGTVTLQVPAGGEIRGGFASQFTQDIGCLPTPAVPCDFDLVLQAPVLKVGLLRQAAGAVPGYLGSTAFAPVLGGKDGFNSFQVLQWPAGVTPQAGYGVDCDATCTLVGQTANFNVLAKLAGPLTAAPSTVDFGGQGAGTASAPRTITITNLGSGPLGLDPTTIDHVAVTGAGAGQYAPATTTCSIAALTAPLAATPMDRDATCSIDLVFTPTGVGPAPATLEIWHTGAATPLTVALNGTGLAVEEVPQVSVTPAGGTLDFGDVRYRTASAVKDVVVSNPGTAPLQVLPSITAATHAGVFSITGNTCPTGFVAPNASCTLGLKFVPSTTGPASATLQIATNVVGSETISIALTGNATGGVAAVASTLIDGFPEWYQDERGVRVGQCADPANALCITAPVSGQVVFPTNYPDEAFYYLATSDDVVVADATCGATEGTLMVETGVEAAFFASVADGDQMTFGRVRFVAGRKGGLCPNTEYVVTFPYGRVTIQTDATGAVKPSPGTTDIGCGAKPCDFAAALSSPVVEGFLLQSNRPAGYLGNPLAPGTVTGAPFVDPDTGQPANHVTIQRKDTMGQPGHTLLGSTDLFGVTGRLAGPMVATPGALDFGPIEVGATSAPLSVTFSNLGTTDVTLASDPFGVSGTGDFTVGTTDCIGGAVLVPGAFCAAEVAFAPSTTGARTAALVLRHSGQNDPLSVPLSGVGAAPVGQPAISAAPSAVVFGDRAIGTVSESQVIHVSNLGGSAPLTVGVPTVDAGAPFTVTSDCLAPVAPDASCGIRVQFAPAAAGIATATVSIPSDAGPAVTVQVTGRGAQPGVAVSSARTTAGFPAWIQDHNGVRLEQCLAVDNCVLLGDATFKPNNPVVFPTNYPMESFYSIVDSELMTIPAQDCPGGGQSAGGTALLRFATEATFVTAQPQAGGQSLFNRIRIKADGLCANMSYEFVHPYGTSTVVTDGAGSVIVTFDSPDFVVDTTDPVLGGFLRWDPNVAPAAPAGHLGDGLSLHRIVGSNYRPDPLGEPANHVEVRLQGVPTVVARTDLFAVAGRLAGPVVASVDALDLGTVRQGHSTAAQHVTITNLGPDAVSGMSVAFAGADAALFSASADSCTGAVLATDQSCSVDVVLTAGAATPLGVKHASLSIGHSGLRSPVTVSLTGEVIFVGQPVLSVGTTSLAFGSVTVGTLAPARTVLISNTGTGPMRMSPIVTSGIHAAQFSVLGTSNPAACPMGGAAPTADIAPGASCTVSIGFVPTSVGSKAASLVIAPTDPAGFTTLTPVTVALSGTGVQGTVSLSATSLSVSARAGRTGTASVKLTNTGNANFSLAGAPALLFWDPATNTAVTSRFTATHNCNNVAPRRTCTVSVSFAPGAGTVGQAYVTDLFMFANVSNTLLDPRTSLTTGGVKVRVTGTRSR